MSSLINTKIKPFKATAFHNGKFIEVTEASLKGKWSIFFFYPADFTFVCPTELGDLADHYAELQKAGVEVYSVSTDTHFTHKAWHETSDTHKKINYQMIRHRTQTATSKSLKFTTSASVARPKNWFAKSKLHNTSQPTTAKCAQLHGNQGPRLSNLPLILLAKSS